MSITPKIPVSVGVPAIFRKFMRQVARRIAAREKETTIESDDLLQCDCIFGGLVDSTRKKFGFCYFHDDGVERDEDDDVTWHVILDATQIQAIADGSLRSLQLWRCVNVSCGCRHSSVDGYCANCDSV